MFVNHFPWSDGRAPVNEAQDVVGCLCCQDTLLNHVQLTIHQEPRPCLSRWSPACISAGCRALHLSLLNSVCSCWPISSSPLVSLWMAAPPLRYWLVPPTWCHLCKCDKSALSCLLQVVDKDVISWLGTNTYHMTEEGWKRKILTNVFSALTYWKKIEYRKLVLFFLNPQTRTVRWV